MSAMMLRNAMRPTLRMNPITASKRSVHISNEVGNNTPFSYANPRALAVKMILFFGTGFSIPFMASAYQIHKASA